MKLKTEGKRAMANKLQQLLLASLLSAPTSLFGATIAEGDCGDGTVWNFSTDSVLTIGGTGSIADYSARLDVPWYTPYAKSIRKIVVEEGVTHIGNYAFADCRATEVDLPEGLESIGNYAFRYCHNISRIDLPASLVEIGKFAFDQTNLDTVFLSAETPPTIGTNAFVNSSDINSDIAGTTSNVDELAFPFLAVPPTAIDAYKDAWPTYAEGIVCPDTIVKEFTSLPTERDGQAANRQTWVYDLYGHLVRHQPEDGNSLQGLPNGIYIQNGKKYRINQ